MSMPQDPQDFPIVIVGLGETGFSCVQYFVQRQLPVWTMDTREAPPRLAEFKARFPSTPISTGGLQAEILQQAKTVVLSPGISKYQPEIVNACSSGTEIIGDIELFARDPLAVKPLVAVTGSNGKSTVTTLVGEMVKASGKKVGVGGNLGIPALSLLSTETECYVLELSSFQLETTYSLKPSVSTILNISPDHLDRHGRIEAYLAAKSRIYDHAESIVMNREEKIILQMIEETVPKTVPRISFGLDIPPENSFGLIAASKTDDLWMARGSARLLPISKLKLFGRHNVSNALAALALGESIQLPRETMLSVLENFRGLAHRCEWVRELKGVQWINDSKGTNVGATVSALRGLMGEIPGKWVLIAGGLGKNADFSPLKPVIRDTCSQVVLMGEAAAELESLLSEVTPCFRAKTLEEAVILSAKRAKPGDGVLLSPACASFDMFKNFEARGDLFKELVKNLA